MTEENKIALLLLILVLTTLLLYAVVYICTEKRKQNKRSQARYKAYRKSKRLDAEVYSKDFFNTYITAILYG